eukprot:11198265-Lingulodinium_polyedra.AAC.1
MASSAASGDDEAIRDMAFAATVRECKWCHRTSDTANPLLYQRGKKSTLPWRRAKGKECANCPWVLAAMPEAKDKVGPCKTGRVLATPLRVGSGKNRTGGSHIKASQPSEQSHVEAFQDNHFEARIYNGWLWPSALYVKHKGQKPSRNKLTTVTVQGKKYTGVVLDEQGPPGTIQLWSVGQVGVKRVAQLADGDNNTVEDMEKTMNNANASLSSIGMRSVKGCDTFKLKQSPAPKLSPTDSEDDDAILDAIWSGGKGRSAMLTRKRGKHGNDSSGSGDDEKKEDETPSKKRKRVPGSSSSTQSKVPQKPAQQIPSTPGRPKDSTPRGGKINKSRELDNAEQ